VLVLAVAVVEEDQAEGYKKPNLEYSSGLEKAIYLNDQAWNHGLEKLKQSERHLLEIKSWKR
jgi:hypothetical protein